MEAEQVIGAKDGPAMRDFLALIKEIFETTGAGCTYARRMKGWLEDAGAVGVEERLVEMYMGVKIGDEVLAGKSARSCAVAVEGLVMYGKSECLRLLFFGSRGLWSSWY